MGGLRRYQARHATADARHARRPRPDASQGRSHAIDAPPRRGARFTPPEPDQEMIPMRCLFSSLVLLAFRVLVAGAHQRDIPARRPATGQRFTPGSTNLTTNRD